MTSYRLRDLRWTLFVARRFLRNRRMTGSALPAALSIAGLGAGVMAIVVVLSVMNGFQMGFIEDILAIRSYHIRIDSPRPLASEKLAKLRALRNVAAVTPFREVQTLAAGGFSEYEPVTLRGIADPRETGDIDFLNQLDFESGVFSMDGPRVVMGVELADALGVVAGGAVRAVSLTSSAGSAVLTATVDLIVAGVFRSGYYEIDSTMAFCSLETVERISPGGAGVRYGVKLDHRYRDREALARIGELLDDPAITLTSWREYNRAFFGALRTEKLVMELLLGLIFVVVAFNIHHSLSRSVVERREEIAVLKALGGTPRAIQAVFVLQGALIGGVGAAAGASVGLAIVSRIDGFFDVLEGLTNVVLRVVSVFFSVDNDAISFFSPAFFYLRSVPVRVLYPEVFLAVSAALLSAFLAAAIAGRRLSRIHPQQVLRYE